MREPFSGQCDDFKVLPHPNPLPMGEGTEMQPESGNDEVAIWIINHITLNNQLD